MARGSFELLDLLAQLPQNAFVDSGDAIWTGNLSYAFLFITDIHILKSLILGAGCNRKAGAKRRKIRELPQGVEQCSNA
jgi:hypothetical protein